MLELAVLRRTGVNQELIDIGLLAETLLFYERVHLLFDGGTLTYLLKTIGPDLLLDVLDRDGVSASFHSENLGTATNTNHGIQTHNFALFTAMPGQARGRRQPKARRPGRASNEEWLAVTVDRAIGAGPPTSKFTKQLLKKLSSDGWKLPTLGSQDLPSVMRSEMDDVKSIDAAVKRVVNILIPSFPIPKKWFFRPSDVGNGYAIETNFDFARLNEEYHKVIPPSHSSLSQAQLLSHLLDARASLAVGFKYLGELVVDPVGAGLIRLKTLELMRKRDAHVEELDLFQDMYLPESRKIRECLNSGERDFAEFLKLLEGADRFKSWLAGINPDDKLLSEYFKAATVSSWVDKLPTKLSRWAITTGLGAAVETLYPTGAAAVISQGISLLDATLLDRVLKGWRPNHFVEGGLTDFVKPSSQNDAA
jgi:hypothetical protein